MRTSTVRSLDSRWRNWAPEWMISHAPSRRTARDLGETPKLVHPIAQYVDKDHLATQIATACFAFRGYDVSNMGRNAELLEHRVYGPAVRAMLDRASILCGDVLGEKVDLAARVLAGEPSTLSTFVQDIATIVAMELAQVQLLAELLRRSRSPGEIEFGPQHRRAVGGGGGRRL